MNTYRRHARDMKRCLIVDDSKVIRMVARKIVQEFGLETEEAADAYVALESCEKSMPDAVLVDWKMPGLNGIEFIRALRAMSGGDQPVAILCTTEEDAAHIEDALAAGASDYLMKPYDGESLLGNFTQMGLV